MQIPENIFHWKIHHFMEYLELNFNDVSFTTKDIVDLFTKKSKGYEKHFQTSIHTHISKLMTELLQNKYVTAKYEALGGTTVTIFTLDKTNRPDNKMIKTIKFNGQNIKDYTNDDNVLNCYVFGSQVYGTTKKNSDVDRILVVKKYFDSQDINVHVYTVEQFQLLINRFDIQAMECLFAPRLFILKEIYQFITPAENKAQLRVSISTIASNSWVKGKKNNCCWRL